MARYTQEDWTDKIDEILYGVKNTMKAKNQDYTAGSGDPFANFRGAESFGMDPLAGLCLRMDDKFQRVKAYFQNGELAVENEGLEDAFNDIIGYAVIARGMIDELKMSSQPTVTINLPHGGGSDGVTDSEESKPSWKDAPVWANWLAQDEDGEWYWYENKPTVDTIVKEWTDSSNGTARDAGESKHFTHWKNSLESRPKDA